MINIIFYTDDWAAAYNDDGELIHEGHVVGVLREVVSFVANTRNATQLEEMAIMNEGQAPARYPGT